MHGNIVLLVTAKIMWVPSIAPATFGRLAREVNVAIEAAVSATVIGNLI